VSPASSIRRADLGQTFAAWGWTDSTFLSLPLFGPSTLRDGLGTLGDMPLDPTFWLFPAGPAKTFVVGSERIGSLTNLVETHQDPYSLIRDLWVLSRRGQVRRFDYAQSESPATDTLQNVFFTPSDPRFGRRARSRKVVIPTTGRKLGYEAWLQKEPAPLVFILPGLGGHRLSKNAVALAELAYNGGFSAVTISSALNFDFMEAGATTTVPGYAPVDARDVHVALDAIARDLDDHDPDRVTSRLLMGMSMGAFHTFFIAAADEDASGLVRFDGHLAISPPVRLSYGMSALDGFYRVPLRVAPEEREERIVSLLQKVVSLASQGDLEPGNPIPLSPGEAEFIIGVGFRLTLHDMIWTSQEMNDQGVLQHPLSRWRRTPVSREILEYSFMEYLYAFALPYYREHLPGEVETVEDLFAHSTLERIATPLRRSGRIRVVLSANDFLVSAKDVAWLQDLLGEQNVYIDQRGGHMGNLWEPEAKAAVLQALSDLVPGESRQEAMLGRAPTP
jgi:predicted alpha/beta-fold hydrolase